MQDLSPGNNDVISSMPGLSTLPVVKFGLRISPIVRRALISTHRIRILLRTFSTDRRMSLLNPDGSADLNTPINPLSSGVGGIYDKETKLQLSFLPLRLPACVSSSGLRFVYHAI